MSVLPLVFGPDPIFRKRADVVADVTPAILSLTEDMLETLYHHNAVGIGANMVGVLQRIIVVDLQRDGKREPLVCLNPEILAQSSVTQTNNEASLCFPGISAAITRSEKIEMRYMDLDGVSNTIEAEGWFAAVLLHETEYLNGRTFLDNLSKMKRDRLIKKMLKERKHKQDCTDPYCGHSH